MVSNEEIEEEDKTKGQKRKRAVKKATPAKKKLKSEEPVKPPVEEINEDEEESSEDGKFIGKIYSLFHRMVLSMVYHHMSKRKNAIGTSRPVTRSYWDSNS